MNSFNQRQFKIMIDKINAYKAGNIYLSDLIGDLEALLNVLEDRTEAWKGEFWGHWFGLEEVYAMALSDEKTELDAEDLSIINESLENLTRMILTAIQEYPEAANTLTNSPLDWGETVIVKQTAPAHYKPGCVGCMCGVRTIDSLELATQFDQIMNSELYLIGFDNGETIEIPRAFLISLGED